MALIALEGAMQAPGRRSPGDAELIRQRIEADLATQSILPERVGDVVRFTARKGINWSYQRYAAVSMGEFQIRDADGLVTVAYRLELRRVFWCALLFAGFTGIFLFAHDAPLVRIVMAGLVFAFIYGPSYGGLAFRTRRFLRRLLAG